MKRTYSELVKLKTFEERFEYLKLSGAVGRDTFGFDRYLNQKFYRTPEWKKIRDYVIVRDCGCDLGIQDRDIYDRIIIHHMNPITATDICNHSDQILDPEQLISTSFRTHNAIHYGDISLVNQKPVERTPNDTCPWRH